jgi:DNA-binding response OmpR family regulator
MSMGADSFVTKPYEMRDLITRVRGRLGFERRAAA